MLIWNIWTVTKLDEKSIVLLLHLYISSYSCLLAYKYLYLYLMALMELVKYKEGRREGASLLFQAVLHMNKIQSILRSIKLLNIICFPLHASHLGATLISITTYGYISRYMHVFYASTYFVIWFVQRSYSVIFAVVIFCVSHMLLLIVIIHFQNANISWIWVHLIFFAQFGQPSAIHQCFYKYCYYWYLTAHRHTNGNLVSR